MLKRSATDCDTHTLINAQRKNTENVWEIGENAHSCTGKKIRTDHHTFDNVLIQVPLSICTLFLYVVLYSFLFFFRVWFCLVTCLIRQRLSSPCSPRYLVKSLPAGESIRFFVVHFCMPVKCACGFCLLMCKIRHVCV